VDSTIRRKCPPNTVPYKTKSGDTLYNIAQRYKTTISAIISANPFLNPYYLQVGLELCIPTQKIYPACPEGNYYRIRPRDTLYSIARFFNVSLDDLIEANPGIEPTRLFIGQVICIPLATPPIVCPPGYTEYYVKSEDTFSSISREFNISLDLLIRANPGINPNALLIGQKLCIPAVNTPNKLYSNAIYNVSFMYPSNWTRIDSEHYEGVDGYFILSALLADATLDEVCQEHSHHQLLPYGTNPKIEKTKVQGRDACFIFPSADQAPEWKGQAALIVSYPRPISIGRQPYNYFVMWAHKDFIRQIASTLKFLVS
jgi:LysM repeat protein